MTSNTAIQESLNADFFLSLSPHTKIKILAVGSPHYEDRNRAAFDRIEKCLRSRHNLSDGQLEFCPPDSEAETDEILQRRTEDLCAKCWKEEEVAEIVINITSGGRTQTQAIVLAASVYGCELVYTDFEPGAWESAICAPNPRRQFLRVVPNQIANTLGIVGLHFACDSFNAKSFALARYQQL